MHWQEEYDKKHRCCPKCGGQNIAATTSGVFAPNPMSYRDSNSAYCHGCGWKGIVHDLKPEKQ